ncbi:SCO6745 family protein [Subtercola sp. YIM 133946]|uniref:SCO6745 family protein n=1 Tax=Subtercola sp. YIM 133946 TaxID=3118909 RepID=UPI002F93F9CC
MPTPEHLARALWTLFEPIHAVTYFSPESRQAFADIGLTRYWDGYFAGRSAPLGPISGAPVVAIFSGFAPPLVTRALPSVWQTAEPNQVIDARAAGAAATLRRLFDDEAATRRAAEALAPIAAAVDTIGRPLAAANRALPIDDDPYRSLWQSTATLREHRGDGHVVALVTEQLGGLSSIVLRTALDLDAATLQRARGWSDDEWMAEHTALTTRGLIDPNGRASAAGIAALERAEALTNRLAAQPWATVDARHLLAVAELLAPLAHACQPIYPFPNPIGMPVPWNPSADPAGLTISPAPTPSAGG